jgi:YidC/Oxa1 family membrane protein insertase
MQKNTLIAVVLSIAVLVGYDTVFVAPKRAEAIKKHQELTSKVPETPQSTQNIEKMAPAVETGKTTEAKIDVLKSGIKSPSVSADFINMGGSLQKINVLPSNKILPIAIPINLQGMDKAFQLTNSANNKVNYRYADSRIAISKSYEQVDEHLLKVRMEIKNLSEISILESEGILALEIDGNLIEDVRARDTMLDEYSIMENSKVVRKGSAFKFTPKENKTQLTTVGWVAFRDHYSAIVVKPEFGTKGYEVKAVTDRKLQIFIEPQDKLGPGQSAVYDFSIYAGPQNAALLKKYNKGFEKVFVFSNYAPLEWIGKAIHYTIPFLHKICFNSWGLAIILFSILIYGLTYPLTVKSMTSMRKMQQMQPKMAALKEKYKNDPQRLNQEMVEIYRREKINPLGGCLPMMLQMPIFIALYQALWRSEYFVGKSFLWIKDLSQADRLFTMPFELPILGHDFNLLPLLMGIVMFAQQKISARNAIVADEAQAMQQKVMTVFFPIFIAVIFYKFASALSLYFTMFYMFSAITQWKFAQKNVK